MLKKLFSVASLFAVCSMFTVLAAPSEASASGWFNCKPTSVFEVVSGTPISEAMLEVSCTTAISPGVSWVGLQSANFSDGQKNRFVSMVTAAILSGKTFRVWASDNQCGNQSNCRYVTAWSFYP